VRIVWHYQASSELRTFQLHYRLSGVAVAYDDVVDVDLQVWGSEWKESLGRLTATMSAAGKIVRAWGHPVYVRGDVQLAGHKALLRALDVPAGQFVEFRAVIPRSAFASASGMRTQVGDGLPKIVANETADAATFEKDKDRIDHAKRHPWRYVLMLLAMGTLPGFLVVASVFWFYGRERPTGYDREYEQEPPTDTEPALVPTLLRQGGQAGSFEFTATLFDLIRRGVYTSTPVTTERATWGGLRTETVSDLELAAGSRDAPLSPWETAVADVVDGVIETGPERLSRFRERIEADRETMSTHFTSFKANVGTEVGNRQWFLSLGAIPLALALLAFLAIGAMLVFTAANGWRSVYPRWSDVVLLGLGIASSLNGAIVLAALTQRKLWRRRSRDGEVEAERWEAFRRYLTDFPRLQEAPPATLALWERLLVYGIAFGIADRVLAMCAEVAAPESAVAVVRRGEFGVLAADVATPLAMVLTELVQNAVEHAAASRIEVDVERTVDALTIVVRDDGQGLPAGFELAESTRLGLKIVRTLVEGELRGTIDLAPAPSGGTAARLVVPLAT